jgi:hypothetical protein
MVVEFWVVDDASLVFFFFFNVNNKSLTYFEKNKIMAKHVARTCKLIFKVPGVLGHL